MKAKRVLITGGAGFVGSHTADALLKCGHEVYCITAAHRFDRDNGNQQRWVESLGIPFTGIEVVASDHDIPTPEEAYQYAGEAKSEAMRKLGCVVLLDDVPPIIIEVRKQGFIGLHVQ